MWWHRREDKHLVPMEDVARIIEACATMYEAGRKAAMPDIPKQGILSDGDADELRRKMRESGASRVLGWLATGEAGPGPAA